MAKAIDLVVAKQALQEVEKLVSILREADDAILNISANARTASQSISGIKTPGGLAQAITENKALTDALKTQMTVIDGVETGLSELAKTRRASTKATVEEKVAIQEANKVATQNARAVSEQVGAYTRLSAQLIVAKREAQNIGAVYGATSKQFITASKNVQILEKELRDIDRALGDNRRNVGNYTGGYNALGASISRLAQELPNAGQSFQIFALSLGNNFAAVQEAITGIIAKNKELKAAGEPTQSVFKQIAGSVFSLNTAFFVGIALFIAYSKEIGEFFSNLTKGAKETNAATQSIKDLNEASVEGRKNAAEELVALKANLAIAKDVNLSYKEREIAVKNLQETYPFYFENLTKEQILAGDTAEAERELAAAILSRAKANAAVNKITENQSALIDLEERRIDVQKRLAQATKDVASAQRVQSQTIGGGTVAGTYDLTTNAINRAASASRELDDINAEIERRTFRINRLTSYALDQKKQSIGLDYQQVKASKELAKEREKIEAITAEGVGTKSLLDDINSLIKLTEELRQANSTTFGEYDQYTKQIEKLQGVIKLITEAPKGDVSGLLRQGEIFEDNKKALQELNIEVEEFIRNISYDFIGNSSLPSLEQFFNGTFDRLVEGTKTLNEATGELVTDYAELFKISFNAIGDVAKDLFSTLSQLSQANFEQEYERLERQKDIAIAFAGESVGAQEEIQRQYDARRRQIAREEAHQKKQTALFEAIVDTASAIVAALPNYALAAAVGVLGAAQIAVIASTPLPAYKHGGVNEKGGLMLVNDAPGSNYRETIVEPDGTIKQPEGRNVVMNAKPGTKIYTPDQWNEYLNGVLQDRGIVPYSLRNFAVRQNEGIDYNKLAGAVVQGVKSMPKGSNFSATVDERGIKYWNNTQNGKTELLNALLRIR